MTRSSGQVIFCDDVREEINGKITLVGCYGPDISFTEPLPAFLPKLGFAARIYTYKREEPFRLAIEIHMPGQSLPILVIDEMVPPPPPNPKLDGIELDENRKVVITMNGVTGPLDITKSGPIRVMATVGEEEFQAGAIMIAAPDAKKARP